MRAAWLAADPAAGLFAIVLAHCGCRISEALALRGRDIDVEECFVAFRSLKKRGQIEVREVPIPHYLAVVLSGHERRNDERLWMWSRSTAWKRVKEIMLVANVVEGPHRTAKGLRHAFGRAVRSGVPLNMIQRWLGHARIETTSIYTQALGIEERELAARMWTASGQDFGISR
jgi:integrase